MSRIFQRLDGTNPWRTLFVASLLGLLVLPVRSEDSPANPVSDLKLVTGRSFGLVLGDLIRQEIQFKVDKPYRLEKAALPKPGPMGKWLELRRIEANESEEQNRYVYRIDVLYQIFPAIRNAETQIITGLALRIFNGEQSRIVHSPETTVTLTPLIPSYVLDSDVKIRPAIEPTPIPLDRHWRKIAILCATLLIVLGYLAWRNDLLPFLRSGKSPFGSARRQIAKWRHATPESPEFRSALLSVHHALNETAGETVFACSLDRFFDIHPEFEPMRETTAKFFALSQQFFFTQSAHIEFADYSIQWLEQMCSEFQKIEHCRQ